MPQDVMEVTEAPPLRKFLIPFKIEGEMLIEATDLEGARYLAEHLSGERYAPHGNLETFEPKEKGTAK